jgi:hypothetical protein
MHRVSSYEEHPERFFIDQNDEDARGFASAGLFSLVDVVCFGRI